MAASGDTLHYLEMPFLHQGAAALTVANQFNNINAPSVQLRKLEFAFDTHQLWFVVHMTLLVCGCQSIEIHGQIHRFTAFTVAVQCVYSIDLDDQILDVFNVSAQNNGFLRSKCHRILIREINIHPPLKSIIPEATHPGHPLLWLPLP